METFLYSVSFFLNSFENPFAFMALVAGSALLVAHYSRPHSVSFFLTLALSFSFAHLTKVTFAIARPEEALVELSSYRFPSMHAVIASALVTSFWWYVILYTQNILIRITATAIAIAVIAGVSYTRIILNVHEVIDVVVGSLIGCSVSLLVHTLLSKHSSTRGRS